jgi:drug/metabolite transporter (DMT)-like permease
MPSLRTTRLVEHVARAALGMAMMAMFFTSLRSLKLADAIAFVFVAPLFTTALSVPLLGDTVGRYRWSAIAIGFLGALVMVRPGTGAFQPAALLVLGGVFFYSLAMVWSRRLSRTDTSAAIACYYTFSTITMSGIVLAFTGWRAPSPEDWGLFLLAGTAGGIGMFCLAEAYRFGEPASIAPVEYSTMLWALLFGWLFWRELPDRIVFAGAALVIGAGLYVIQRERRRGIAPIPATPPLTTTADTPPRPRSTDAPR